MTEKEKMLAGDIYSAVDPQLITSPNPPNPSWLRGSVACLPSN